MQLGDTHLPSSYVTSIHVVLYRLHDGYLCTKLGNENNDSRCEWVRLNLAYENDRWIYEKEKYQ